ncbi:hypothetical protein FRAHR75_480025 [Frankia sp. Hr75.2]|nr:hypothetical protein FRAHR75_480025 [Frankia sp. Hr75.2]
MTPRPLPDFASTRSRPRNRAGDRSLRRRTALVSGRPTQVVGSVSRRGGTAHQERVGDHAESAQQGGPAKRPSADRIGIDPISAARSRSGWRSGRRQIRAARFDCPTISPMVAAVPDSPFHPINGNRAPYTAYAAPGRGAGARDLADTEARDITHSNHHRRRDPRPGAAESASDASGRIPWQYGVLWVSSPNVVCPRGKSG